MNQEEKVRTLRNHYRNSMNILSIQDNEFKQAYDIAKNHNEDMRATMIHLQESPKRLANDYLNTFNNIAVLISYLRVNQEKFNEQDRKSITQILFNPPGSTRILLRIFLEHHVREALIMERTIFKVEDQSVYL